MSQAALSMCDVCGSDVGADGCCGTCGTILVEGKVECERCGDPLKPYSLVCYSCGSTREEEHKSEDSREKKEAVHHFLMIPGLSEEAAGDLYDDGIEDFASLVGLALTEPQRNTGLHQVIARRIMLMDIVDTDHSVANREEIECPICKSIIDAASEACPICGHFTRIKLEVPDGEFDGELDPVMGELNEKITWDAAFRQMPKDFQEELSRVLAEAEEPELEDIEDEFDVYWDELDSDLEELLKEAVEPEVELEEEPELPETIMICPLCDTEVVQDAHFCYNCGAQFGEA
jgi:predicted amidophosphoribosyltransferase